MPVLGGVGERSGKQGRFLRPRRDLGERRRADREIDCCAGDQGNRRIFAPSGGRGLTVPVGHALCDERRQVGDVDGDPPRLVPCEPLGAAPPDRLVLEIAKGKGLGRSVVSQFEFSAAFSDHVGGAFLAFGASGH